MVYTKARRYIASAKRKYRRVNKWSKTPQTPRALAWQAYKQVKYLKGLVNSEMMHVDTTNTLGANSNAIFHLTGISQGDNDGNRTGNSLLIRTIYLRGLMEISSSVTGDTRVLLALVKDKQQISDTTPSVTDIFQSTSPESMLKLGNSGRFKVMWRKTYVLAPVAGGRNAVEINKYWKVYDHVRYNGTNSTDIQKNGYYLVVITSEIAASAPNCVITSRIGYHDN